MPTTHLYFVRHGETDYNRDGIMQGRGVDTSINATGRAQADALARLFADVDIQAIYSSSLRRARETAAVIAAHHPSVPVHATPQLDEMSWGVVEGRSRDSDAVESIYSDLYDHWDRGEFDKCVDGGESVLDVQKRGLAAVTRIAEQHAGERIVIVTHGRFLRVILASLLDDYGLERMNDIPHDNAAVNHLVVRSGAYTLERLNSTDHLADVGATALNEEPA